MTNETSKPSKTKPKRFDSKAQAQEFIFSNHLEEFTGLPHSSVHGGWVVVYRHPPTGEWAVYNENGTGSILDW